MQINLKNIGLVFAGGALGTLLRDAISVNTPGVISLVVVNVVGAILIGWLNADPRFATESKRAFWAVGVAGGFTTMSGVALFLVLAARLHVIGIIVVAILFALSLLAYWASHALTSRLTGNEAAVSHEIEEASE